MNLKFLDRKKQSVRYLQGEREGGGAGLRRKMMKDELLFVMLIFRYHKETQVVSNRQLYV